MHQPCNNKKKIKKITSHSLDMNNGYSNSSSDYDVYTDNNL